MLLQARCVMMASIFLLHKARSLWNRSVGSVVRRLIYVIILATVFLCFKMVGDFLPNVRITLRGLALRLTCGFRQTYFLCADNRAICVEIAAQELTIRGHGLAKKKPFVLSNASGFHMVKSINVKNGVCFATVNAF